MAGGMHAVALGSGIYDEWGQGKEDEGVMLAEVGESIEITALDDDTSQAAAQILKDRQRQNTPISATKFQCRSDEQDEVSKARKKKDDQSPLVRLLYHFMPVFTWLPQVNRKIVQADIIAGVTVGVMVIPQGMSYAAIAGLPYIYGLYSACVPTFMYAFFGQSRQLAVGPVAMVSLLVEAGLRGQLTEEECPEWYALGADTEVLQSELCPEQYVSLAFLTAATVGVMQILGSILKLGFLVSFLGHPVTSGFTSGAAIIIGLSQLKYILGYDIPKSQFVHVTVGNIVSRLGETQGMCLFLGLLWLAFLMLNKQIARRYKRLSIMGALGPLVSCGVGILLMSVLPVLHEDFHVKYIGEIPSGLMPLSFSSWKFSNVPKVLPTAMSACLIGYMESIAIGKNLAAKHGYEIDAGQEMLAVGISNLVGSALSCYPVTGSFSRSAVNNSTGAQSQLSGFVTSVLMFCVLLVLTPLFYYLPKFALAAVVLNSVIALVAYDEAIKLWRIKKGDCILWFVAFFGTLFLGVLMGIAVAVSLSLIIVIYQSARPQISILWRIPGTTMYRNMKQEGSGNFVQNVFICRIGSSIYFANAAYIKDMILTYVSDLEEVNKTSYIILEMTPVVTIDSTAVHVLQDIVHDCRSRNIQTAFCMVGNRVEKTMKKAKLREYIGEQWFFPTVHDAVQYCLKHQQATRRRESKSREAAASSGDGEVVLDVEAINVQTTTEVGISNDAHSSCSVVFITLSKDVSMIIGEIVAVFKKNRLRIVRAQMDPLDEDGGTKHTYFLKNSRTDSKLTEDQIHNLREDLDSVIWRARKGEGTAEFTEEGGICRSSLDLAGALAGRGREGPREEKERGEQARPGMLGVVPESRCWGTACALM